MPEHPVQGYVGKVRYERRNELAKLARDRHADLSLILGLSWRIKSWQAHVDYVGGIDTAKLQRGLASLRNLEFSLPKVTQVPVEAELLPLPSLKDSLVQAAPVDFQYGRSRRTAGQGVGRRETAEQQQQRIVMETERKHREFAGILSHIDTDAVAHLALDILQSQRSLTVLRRPRPLPLPQISSPFFGSAHVFYVIQFYDDRRREVIKWIIKIPATGTPDLWDKLCAETLRTEALLLNMLKTETDVPVPEVIDADCSAHNEIHVPYLIMEYVQGRRLEDVWFDTTDQDDEALIMEKRARILEHVAKAMVQLGQYEFDSGGMPLFDGEGVLVGTGPLRELDVQTMIACWFANEDCERTPVYRGVGPWNEPEDMYTAMLDEYTPVTETGEGVDKLLRLLIRLVREPRAELRTTVKTTARRTQQERGKGKKFVLAHPDLSMRNIIIADDGSVKAILGWDGARAAPRSLGNEALPRWLVRDFNPFVWRWQPAPDFWRRDHVPPECNRFEDAPWTLRELRGRYVQIIARLKGEKRSGRRTAQESGDGGERRESNSGQGDDDGVDVLVGLEGEVEVNFGEGKGEKKDEVNVTKQSLLALTLDAAVRDPRCRIAALRRVLEKCSRSFEEFDFNHFVETLGDGRQVDGYRLKCLGRNIAELVDKGFVRGAVVW
ncbi:hypothetical protein F5X99DRAFT_94794 [Biscogniauxia marginata]|nr:hypothetical protein F5X99DRAFT_94794 [Biscogniauxia marginata]